MKTFFTFLVLSFLNSNVSIASQIEKVERWQGKRVLNDRPCFLENRSFETHSDLIIGIELGPNENYPDADAGIIQIKEMQKGDYQELFFGSRDLDLNFRTAAYSYEVNTTTRTGLRLIQISGKHIFKNRKVDVAVLVHNGKILSVHIKKIIKNLNLFVPAILLEDSCLNLSKVE